MTTFSLFLFFRTPVQGRGAEAYLWDLLYYLYNEGNLDDSSQFWAFLHQKFSKKVEDKVMTLGQQAAQQAELKTLKEIALRMLEEKCDIPLISRVTNLSQQEIKRLAQEKTN
jgi:hypothetical protein